MKLKVLTRSLVLATLIMVSFGIFGQVFAQTNRPVVTPSPVVTTTAAAHSATENGPHFFKGEDITLTQDLTGDVYVVGRNIKIENKIDGDLLVAGGQVTITGTVSHDVRAAGGMIDVRGTIGGNLSVASANLTLDRQSQVGGSVVAASGTSNFYGLVSGNTRLASSTTTLDGKFGQNVDAVAQKFNLDSDTSITGDLSAQVSDPPIISQAAQVKGQTNVQQVAKKPVAKPNDASQSAKKIGLWLIITLLMNLVGAAILLALFPRAAFSVSTQINASPVASFAWGLAYIVLMPFAALLLLVTVVGIPLSVILLLVYLLTLILGLWVVSLAVGKKFLPDDAQLSYGRQLSQLFIGLVILKALEVIPVVGIIVKIVVIIMGVGGLVVIAKRSFGLQPAAPQPAPVVPLKSKSVPVTSKSKSKRGRSKKK